MTLVFALMLTIAAPAPLDVDPRFQSAQAAMQQLDYERAQTLFDALAAEPHDAKESARLYVWSGAARALLGDEMAARLAFESAVRLDDACMLEVKTSPKVSALLEEARAKIVAEKRAQEEARAQQDARIEEARVAQEREAQLAAERAAAQRQPSAQPIDAAARREPHAATQTAAPLALWLGAGAGALVGVVGLGVGGFLAWQAKTSADVAADKSTPQVDVQDHVDAANGLVPPAAISAGVGIVALGAGLALGAVALTWGDSE